MTEGDLHKHGFNFTSKYMRVAFTNGELDVIVIKRNDSYIEKALLCDSNGFKLDDNIKTIEDVLKYKTK